MPIKRRRPKERRGGLTPEEHAWLHELPYPEDCNRFTLMDLASAHLKPDGHHHPQRPPLRDLWSEHGAGILLRWVRERPGTRPRGWWAFDAPRAPGREWAEPRATVAGTGRAGSVGEHGEPTNWRFIDPADPPWIESEAAYLLRHDLLLRGERRRVRAKAFEPEAKPHDPDRARLECIRPKQQG